ncbi:MAG: hypothetical protein JEZ00_03885 [Anaerolineaceae bacterium]|nr:hypothetical protein [Anaerolineaceae bacterium]
MMKEILKKANRSNLVFDLFIVSGIFLVGLSLANYLGVTARFDGFIFGWISCVLLFIGIKVMEFYTLSEEQLDMDHSFLKRIFPGLSATDTKKLAHPEYTGLIILLIFFGSWSAFQFVLLKNGILSDIHIIWLALILITTFLLGMPTLRIVNSGFAELIQAMLLFGLIPIYAYQVISGQSHILMSLMCMPIALFYLAAKLIYGLYKYSEDQKSGRQNFLQKTGWKQGMVYHNMFLLLGFVVFACIPLFGFATRIFLNPLLVLPLGLVVIMMLYRIEHGKKPEWQSLIFIEKVLILLVFYFLIAAMILR